MKKENSKISVILNKIKEKKRFRKRKRFTEKDLQKNITEKNSEKQKIEKRKFIFRF